MVAHKENVNDVLVAHPTESGPLPSFNREVMCTSEGDSVSRQER